MTHTNLSAELKTSLFDGVVIPAMPLALNQDRRLDEHRQRVLCRYYIAAGAGGLAVGVHTTQFAIRDESVNLYKPVLKIVAEEIEKAKLERPFIKVAGVCGPTEQAIQEAKLAVELGYDLGLVSMGGLNDWTEQQLLDRLGAIGEIIPIFGFYLQTAVGGRKLTYDFWRQMADFRQVMAIKIAPFNRYQTLDVIRAVCNSKRCNEIALYTGNDDNIVADLLTPYRFQVNNQIIEKQLSGGLLGQWAIWTKKAVELLKDVKKHRNSSVIPAELLQIGTELTDVNGAVFDAANNFRGCIAGIHQVLYRQGLIDGIWCLDPSETLSPGQKEEVDRVYNAYHHLNDDVFIQKNIKNWLY